jgi:hypothetical protein
MSAIKSRSDISPANSGRDIESYAGGGSTFPTSDTSLRERLRWARLQTEWMPWRGSVLESSIAAALTVAAFLWLGQRDELPGVIVSLVAAVVSFGMLKPILSFLWNFARARSQLLAERLQRGEQLQAVVVAARDEERAATAAALHERDHALKQLREDPRARPRIRVVIADEWGPKGDVGERRRFWGLRVFNDGAPAVFEARIQLKAGNTTLSGGRRYRVSFSRAASTESRIATGADDVFFIGYAVEYPMFKGQFVEWGVDGAVGEKALWYFDEQERTDVEAPLRWGSQWGTHSVDAATAEIEITITADPAPLEGPWTGLFQFGPAKLTTITR